MPDAWLSRDKRNPAGSLSLNVLSSWVLHQLRYEDEEARGRRFTDDELQCVRDELEDWQAAPRRGGRTCLTIIHVSQKQHLSHLATPTGLLESAAPPQLSTRVRQDQRAHQAES